MTKPTPSSPEAVSVAVEDDTTALVAKLSDVLTPGFVVEFDPIEAEQAGAFVEDALSEPDAAESHIDLVDASAPAVSGSEER
jgi:hypothetical protein